MRNAIHMYCVETHSLTLALLYFGYVRSTALLFTNIWTEHSIQPSKPCYVFNHGTFEKHKLEDNISPYDRHTLL